MARPIKDESEKVKILQIPIIGKDKDDLMDYIKQIGFEGREKEFLTASILSCTSTVQYLDFEDQVKEIDEQIARKTVQHDRNRKRIEQELDDLDTDFKEDIESLESKKASILAKMVSIKRYSDNPSNGALSNATDQLRPIVQQDKDKIVQTMYDIKIARQTTVQADSIFTENKNGFWDRLTDLANDLYTIKVARGYINQDDFKEKLTNLKKIANRINWEMVSPKYIDQAKGILSKSYVIKYIDKYDELKTIIDLMDGKIDQETRMKL